MHYGIKSWRIALAAFAVLAAAPSFAQGQPAAKPAARAARIAGQPNLNGVWQAMNTADWNLEAHSAQKIEGFYRLGSLAAIPAGLSVVDGDGKIPYKPEALAKRNENRAKWPENDPEVKCYLPGIPRATYMPFPFQIVQSTDTILISYEFADAVRTIHMTKHEPSATDSWMGWSNGRWDGDTLVVDVTGLIEHSWLDRAGDFHSESLHVVERYTPVTPYHLQYEATIEDPKVFTRPWKISLPLYKHIEPNAELSEFKCVPFSEEILYGAFKAEAAASR
jgi:hypothetical protein